MYKHNISNIILFTAIGLFLLYFASQAFARIEVARNAITKIQAYQSQNNQDNK